MSVQKFLTQKLNKLALFYCIFYSFKVCGLATGIISTVYNLRVSETTKLITEESTDPFGFEFTFFEQARWANKNLQTNKSDRSNAVGELATFLYVVEPVFGDSWYMRADFAVARVSEVSDGKSLARIQTDDFLLTAGYSWLVHSRIRLTVSGLVGIPTHKDTSLNQIQLGTGHLGLGIQLDAAIKYRTQSKCSIRTAARIVGTIPRKTTFQCWDYNFNLGEFIDIFIAHHAPFGKHCLEIGYNPTFVVAGGISPHIPSLESEFSLIRNSYYMAYEYNFDIRKVNSGIQFGLSFSSDVIPKKTGQKLIVFGWFSWGISF